MILKKDLLIVEDGRFKIYIRKRILYFFNRWIPLTYQYCEFCGVSTVEKVEFNTFDEAIWFINSVAK